MAGYLRNIENQQYNKFETMFRSKRREEVTDIFENLPKQQVVAIIDSYDEMVHEVAPNVIGIKDCVMMAIENGMIEPNLNDISNAYRQLAASIIDEVEEELFDILPDPESDEEMPDNANLSKICGETYYSLEDRLTDLFKNMKF